MGRSTVLQGRVAHSAVLLLLLPCCHLFAFCLRRRFWKRIVKGTAPPVDLRSGSSLVQLSRTGPDGPKLSFVDASSASKLPGQNGGAALQHH